MAGIGSQVAGATRLELATFPLAKRDALTRFCILNKVYDVILRFASLYSVLRFHRAGPVWMFLEID